MAREITEDVGERGGGSSITPDGVSSFSLCTNFGRTPSVSRLMAVFLSSEIDLGSHADYAGAGCRRAGAAAW